MNKQGIMAGQIDTELTPKGIKQTKKAAEELKDIKFDTLYSSDLKRAIKTAEIIYGKPVPRKNRLRNLREGFNGEMEGQPRENIKSSEEAKYRLSPKQRWLYKNTPGMESDQEIYERFIKALESIAIGNKGKTILISGHDGPMRTVLMKLQHLRHEDLPRNSFKNAGYVQLIYEGRGFKVVKVSDVQL